MNENECCATCKYNVEIQKWDYTDVRNNGVVKTTLEGHGCMLFLSEGKAIQKIGIDPDDGMCECYYPKEE